MNKGNGKEKGKKLSCFVSTMHHHSMIKGASAIENQIPPCRERKATFLVPKPQTHTRTLQMSIPHIPALKQPRSFSIRKTCQQMPLLSCEKTRISEVVRVVGYAGKRVRGKEERSPGGLGGEDEGMIRGLLLVLSFSRSGRQRSWASPRSACCRTARFRASYARPRRSQS